MSKSAKEETSRKIKLVECPRDAMQGWKQLIPTDKKIEYLNALLNVGFHTLDFGSFVSPKAIPQMADTRDVIQKLDLTSTSTHLLAIVANYRGAEEACAFDEISFLGYPFSISETFQKKNTNSDIEASFVLVNQLVELCAGRNKQLVVYLSMGFGNPYGDEYSEDVVYLWLKKLASAGIKIMSIADTVGLATPQRVEKITHHAINNFPEIEIGVHLHAHADSWRAKAEAALNAGCMRFDGAMRGVGGCPMANDELVGNLDTEKLIAYFDQKGLLPRFDNDALLNSSRLAADIFS